MIDIGFDGRRQHISAWAREIGVSRHVLRWRLKNWSLERALTTPGQQHSKLISHDGRTQNMNAWARELGINKRTLRGRLRRGEPVEMALQGRRRRRL